MKHTYTWQEIAGALSSIAAGEPVFLLFGAAIFAVLAGWVLLEFALPYITNEKERILPGLWVLLPLFIGASIGFLVMRGNTLDAAELPILESNVPVAQLPDSLRGITPYFEEVNTTSPYYRVVKAPGRHAPIQITVYCSKQYLEDTLQPVVLYNKVYIQREL